MLDEAVKTAEKCLHDIHCYERLPREYTFTTGIPEGYTLSTTDELMEAADMMETEYILRLLKESWAVTLRERDDFRRLLEHYSTSR